MLVEQLTRDFSRLRGMLRVTMPPAVDLVVLTRGVDPLHPDVEQGIRSQRGVQARCFRVVGHAHGEDQCRWDAIVRARNEGKTLGDSSWLMFLDDDVVLEPTCIADLVAELRERPLYTALAADYLGQRRHERVANHVAMGATLFRRDALKAIQFRWERDKCECQCCCDDLRRRFCGIDYSSRAQARHLPGGAPHGRTAPCSDAPSAVALRDPAPGTILAGFDRQHLSRFVRQFLGSLRASGNDERVIAAAVGLYPSERRQLLSLPNVTPVFLANNRQSLARRRLVDFREIVQQLPSSAPVAYWDVGDVIFQERLAPLWDIVAEHPNLLLAAPEPWGHPENPAVDKWTRTIRNAKFRRRAFHLLATHPYLNGGFAAGAAGALARYFRVADDWLRSPVLAGTADWGDQTALNLYCRTFPDLSHIVDEGWNYCLCGRTPGQMVRQRDGRFIDARGKTIYAVHGNAGTFRPYSGIARAPVA